MKLKIYQLTLAAVTAAALTGCETPYGTPDNTGTGMLAGGAIGAGSGALIGSASGHAGEGALIGAAIGTITGGLVGHSVDQQQEAALRAQSPQTYARVEQGQPLSVADVKALVAAKISDDTVIAQIQSSHTVYHLSTADIIDLHNSGVSEKVVDYMINTPSTAGSAPAETVVAEAPPAPPVETVVAAPGPGYVWVGGDWAWNGAAWVWVGGHWMVPPYPGAVWVVGGWHHGPRGWYRAGGYWH
jgi:uncharacterized protein YcfJ